MLTVEKFIFFYILFICLISLLMTFPLKLDKVRMRKQKFILHLRAGEI
jgi:hypothetical protein